MTSNLFPEAANLWNSMKIQYGPSRMKMLESRSLTIGQRTMNFQYKTKGARPVNGYVLIFGFHGGGGCTEQVNNQQYNNHKKLYESQLPDGTIWFTPRSIQNLPDMWFRNYFQDFVLQIVRAFALNDLIDINKVFITGYSAGGDGIYHMAPRMADHLAGAAMMAGHPNGINLMNIRNIGFSIQVGGQDNAYNRKNQAIKYIRMVNQLGQNYGGFPHCSKVHQGKPHWMNNQDGVIFKWLLNFTRNPYPSVILYKQCPKRSQKYFYYLKIGQSTNNKDKQQFFVIKQDNSFYIYGNRVVTVYVNRNMIDPRFPIRIIHNDKVISERMMQSKPQIINKTLLQRIDPYYIFQDQFVSEPPSVIDITTTMCACFGITPQQKQAEYEQQLGMDPQKTTNFNTNLHARFKRRGPFKHKALARQQQLARQYQTSHTPQMLQQSQPYQQSQQYQPTQQYQPQTQTQVPQYYQPQQPVPAYQNSIPSVPKQNQPWATYADINPPQINNNARQSQFSSYLPPNSPSYLYQHLKPQNNLPYQPSYPQQSYQPQSLQQNYLSSQFTQSYPYQSQNYNSPEYLQNQQIKVQSKPNMGTSNYAPTDKNNYSQYQYQRR